MEKKKVKITISGEAATGKSTLALLLEEFLREQGFDVSINLKNELFDYGSELQFRAVCSLDWNKKLESIKEKVKITLKSKQMKRENKETQTKTTD